MSGTMTKPDLQAICAAARAKVAAKQPVVDPKDDHEFVRYETAEDMMKAVFENPGK